MSQRKWTEEQIIGILKQVEAGRTVVEVCREHGVGESTFYKWNTPRGHPMRRLGSQRSASAQVA